MLKKTLLVFAFLFSFSVTVPVIAGTFQVPNYAASADVKQQAQTKGKDITDLVAMIAVIIDIITLIWGAMRLGSNPEEGKKQILYSVIGLVVIGLAYGIAVYALK